MKKCIFIFSLLFTFTVFAHAQVESKRDSIAINLKEDLPEENKTFEMKSELDENISEKISPEELHRRQEFVKTLKFKVPKFYVGPQPEYIGDTIGRILPSTYNYSFYDYIAINEGIAMSYGSHQNVYPSIGATREVNANFIFETTDWLIISGGVYAAKYTMPGYSAYGPNINHFNDLGFNASMRFKLHDRIYLRAHGMYSINSNDKNRNFTPVMTGLFPQTYYGAGMEFKITDTFGVEGGLTRVLNPLNGKWENQPYIMPVFYSTGRR